MPTPAPLTPNTTSPACNPAAGHWVKVYPPGQTVVKGSVDIGPGENFQEAIVRAIDNSASAHLASGQ